MVGPHRELVALIQLILKDVLQDDLVQGRGGERWVALWKQHKPTEPGGLLSLKQPNGNAFGFVHLQQNDHMNGSPGCTNPLHYKIRDGVFFSCGGIAFFVHKKQ